MPAVTNEINWPTKALPKEEVNEVPPEIIAHNWSYAIAPIFNNEFSGGLYLTGFCKNCQTAFTSRLHTEKDWQFIGKLDYTEFNIPLFGCIYKRH
jgi:hypothetical protein